MLKITYYTIFILLISSCGVSNINRSSVVNLILYTDFVNPQKTYDSLRNDFTQSGLIDSLIIVGRPIEIPSIEFHIDTLRVKQYELSLLKVQKKIETIDKSKTLNELKEQFIISESGQKVPIIAFTHIYGILEFYEPKIYLPKPETYYYNDKRAVKIKFYCNKKNKKELIEFINNKVFRYSDDFIDKSWIYEIVKKRRINNK